MTEEPGGYQRDAGEAFGLFIKPHKHDFRPHGMRQKSHDGKNLYDDLVPRCAYCDRSEREVEEAESP